MRVLFWRCPSNTWCCLQQSHGMVLRMTGTYGEALLERFKFEHKLCCASRKQGSSMHGTFESKSDTSIFFKKVL